MATTPAGVSGRSADELPRPEEPGVNKRLIAAGAFLVLIVVIALLVFLRGGDNATSTAPPGPGPGQSVPSGAAADTAVPSSPPPARWDLYRTVALPYSEQAGPAKVDGEIASGFAHTPIGALFASTHAAYRYRLAPDSAWMQVTEAMIQPGPGRDAWARVRAGYQLSGSPPAGSMFQMAGFRFVTYSPETAVIQVVTRGVRGTLQMTTSTVAWDGGDWKLVLQPDGSESPTAQRVDSLDGFVPWSGI